MQIQSRETAVVVTVVRSQTMRLTMSMGDRALCSFSMYYHIYILDF
ncbi:hypothetical protein [Scytonema tolypothrichoides]